MILSLIQKFLTVKSGRKPLLKYYPTTYYDYTERCLSWTGSCHRSEAWMERRGTLLPARSTFPSLPQCASRGCHMPTCTTYPLSPGPRTHLLRRSHLLPPLCRLPASVFARAASSARGASAIFCTREAPLPGWKLPSLPFSDFTILCPGLPHRCTEVVYNLYLETTRATTH